MEKKKWIQEAINPENKGSLRKTLHTKAGNKIPLAKLTKAEHSKNPLTKKRAVLAKTLRGIKKK